MESEEEQVDPEMECWAGDDDASEACLECMDDNTKGCKICQTGYYLEP